MDVTGGCLYKSNMSAPDVIPTYNLYGESAALADVVHMEAIADRSARHGWKIRPHRHGWLHQFLLVEAGGGSAGLGGEARALEPPVVLNLPPGVVHDFAFHPGTLGRVLTMPAETVGNSLGSGEGLAAVLRRAGMAPADEEILAAFGQLRRDYEARRFGRAQRLRALVGLMAGLVAAALHGEEAQAAPGADPLALGFLGLVEAHHREHWQVADYAAALSVSPGHLSRVCRAELGQSATGILRERLLREARRQLAYTTRGIARVAYDLGYADPAYFTRVFTRATGLSPSAYRAALDRGGGGLEGLGDV